MPRIGEKIDKYQITGVLGSGAFGTVYLVEWTGKKGKQAQGALKILKNPKNRNVVREAITWARVSHHKNVLTFLDAPEDGDQLLLLSEYAPDGSLQDWITNYGGSEERREEAIDLMCGILEGLAHLHDYGVIHRDIKPQNILLNGDIPLLADFGLSRELELSQSSMLAGTLPYMSPDLCSAFLNTNLAANKYERTGADDLWATAITFYQMVTGFFPFQYVMQILSADAFEISDKLPENLRSFLAKALHKDKNERFESASEMREALRPTVMPEESNANAKPLLSPEDYAEKSNTHRALVYDEFDEKQ
jgi:serine/threonine-protein kinase